MSFRKRNVGLTSPSTSSNNTSSPINLSAQIPSSLVSIPGVRPSPLDGRPTTSTGTQTLDDLLAGHAGLPLGHSLLIEENGTTDFAGALLRFYAAEGLVQGHRVHVVGIGEQWGRELPGLVEDGGTKAGEKHATEGTDKEKMKIAWRYERLGEFGAGTRVPPLSAHTPQSSQQTLFTHTFDLSKRLQPSRNTIEYLPLPFSSPSPYAPLLATLTTSLKIHHQTPHRLLMPNLLTPPVYHPSPDPTTLLPFLHSLRALLRQYPNLTAMTTLPLSLYSRHTGLVRWIELLSDGVIELAPFPYTHNTLAFESTTSSASEKKEDRMQGLVRVHKLPVFTERGGGSGCGAEDMAFKLGRRKFDICPFHLPPIEGDEQEKEIEAKALDF